MKVVCNLKEFQEMVNTCIQKRKGMPRLGGVDDEITSQIIDRACDLKNLDMFLDILRTVSITYEVRDEPVYAYQYTANSEFEWREKEVDGATEITMDVIHKS